MLGEFGDNIIEAPYMLETIINNYEEEQSVVIKLQLLSAAMKLFFKRPPEMQHMLGRLFSCALNESTNQDLHDRALLYYRLLKTNLKTAESIFKKGVSEELRGGQFAEHAASERTNMLFQEFNTLAITYGKPSNQFIAEAYQMVSSNIFVIFYSI
jgi:AP-4 complex subunit beta-1